MEFIMLFRQFMLWMAVHTRDIKMLLPILIKPILNQKFFQEPLGEKIAEAEEIRYASDYDDFYIATREEAEDQITTALELIAMIENYLKDKM